MDHRDGTWTVAATALAPLSPGTYDVKVTAQNSIGLVRTDATTNELTIAARPAAGQAAPPVARWNFDWSFCRRVFIGST